jgi:hypothetical protein
MIFLSYAAYAQQGVPPVAPNTTEVTFTVGKPVSIWTLQDRLNSGLLYYPDMPIGVIRTQDNQGYLFFSSGSGANQSTQPNGVYVSLGSLDKFIPAKFNSNGPEPSMELGRLQPAPDGNYDRDYAGGGPTYVINEPFIHLMGVINQKPSSSLPFLLQLYHGEYHPNAPNSEPFYGVSALTVSYDYGNSFAKIGEILSPHETLEEVTQTGKSVTADGSLVEADENGYPIEGNHVDPKNVYIYSIFSDRASSTSLAGFSIARVNKSDFISAIKNKKAPLFNKYYNPITSIPPASPGDFFTEPGIGGNSTFIYSAAPNYIATPQVHYDGALKEFIMVYPQNQNSVWISTAQNLFNWSPPPTSVFGGCG